MNTGANDEYWLITGTQLTSESLVGIFLWVCVQIRVPIILTNMAYM